MSITSRNISIQLREGKILDLDKAVRVYRNLHTKRGTVKYSIQQGGYVVAHASEIHLNDVIFLVNLKTRDYAEKLGKKMVHAFVCGKIAAPKTGIEFSFQAGGYIPAKGFFFLRKDEGQALRDAKFASLTAKGLEILL